MAISRSVCSAHRHYQAEQRLSMTSNRLDQWNYYLDIVRYGYYSLAITAIQRSWRLRELTPMATSLAHTRPPAPNEYKYTNTFNKTAISLKQVKVNKQKYKMYLHTCAHLTFRLTIGQRLLAGSHRSGNSYRCLKWSCDGQPTLEQKVSASLFRTARHC